VKRREFLRLAGATSAGVAIGGPRLIGRSTPAQTASHTFEVTTRVEVLQPAGPTRVWVPAPLTIVTPYQTTLGNAFHAEGGSASFVEQPAFGVGIVAVEWPEGVKPLLTLTSRVVTREFAVDLSQTMAAGSRTADPAVLKRFLEPTSLVPTDGIVKETAEKITRGARTDIENARAIYDWIVENTFRDPKTRGCGLGDIRFILESKNLGGKCADLNALFVGLARASGLPARDAYGIRVAPSARGFKSLGAATSTITKAQHCRAEVYLAGHGCVPVDPADVRKVVLEEPPGNLSLSDEKVRRARASLFGSWEMNWIAFNFGSDVELPGSTRGKLPFFMYPQAETASGRLDSLDADAFRYEITSAPVAM
jgi:transglutaminase-like putative cysteine protease